jgi:hypothetical protein
MVAGLAVAGPCQSAFLKNGQRLRGLAETEPDGARLHLGVLRAAIRCPVGLALVGSGDRFGDRGIRGAERVTAVLLGRSCVRALTQQDGSQARGQRAALSESRVCRPAP